MRVALPALTVFALGTGAALAHGGAPHAGPAAAAWNFDPWVSGPLGLIALVYGGGMIRLWRRAAAGRPDLRRKALLFGAGWLALAVALVSPVDALGEALFSAHMVQHELLMLVAAPLLVLATPGAALLSAVPRPGRKPLVRGLSPLRRLWRAASRPLPAWSLHALVLWGWHHPALFGAALEIDVVHWLQHLSFLAAALVFWRSLFFAPDGAGIAVMSLFTTAIHASLLGALLVFSPDLWYAGYAGTTGEWGLRPLADQQLGGLIMWMPGGLVYLVAALWLLGRWLRLAGDRDAAVASPSARRAGS